MTLLLDIVVYFARSFAVSMPKLTNQSRFKVTVECAMLTHLFTPPPPPPPRFLQVVGVFLRDTVSSDGSLWVVATAMDALFDVFGSDSCPPTMFADLGILPVLQEAASTFRARVSCICACVSTCVRVDMCTGYLCDSEICEWIYRIR